MLYMCMHMHMHMHMCMCMHMHMSYPDDTRALNGPPPPRASELPLHLLDEPLRVTDCARSK